ncbi:MAG: bifunctional glutamate N-acetyltransferase/amino-acid acetyltransferase ArgJ [Candidatus Omnitrophica bacterium]|nr:bifunctional glutamate N-acetyltransferase/amino-acid acetyltransferase ArgJ [Candidatus Omnitrophota bacterium]
MKLPEGFLLSGMHCGLKKKKLDLGLIYVYGFGKAVGFFTKNRNPSYSILLSKKNINNPVKAILVNSGNANCYSHPRGYKDTEDIAASLADCLKVDKGSILIASTGIIGRKLAKDKIIKNLPVLIKSLSKDCDDFAESLMTTDTFAKKAQIQLKFGQGRSAIAGFAKGAGMIYPDMATMLGFILTDIFIPGQAFKRIAREAVEESFNSISIDGCTSTNDNVLLISSRKMILKKKCDIDRFKIELKRVCLKLAKMIVEDAEGATKFVEILIKGAKTKLEAKRAGFSLANSNLFKCAIYGENANWGRIIAALGQAGIKVKEDIKIKASDLKKKNISISIDLKRGKDSFAVYTSDLTPEYVKINADYS